MTRHAPTIFLSAFLLFQVQPLIAKYILPWFGGSPAVWTTCMLFFQVLLLAGYAYSHLTSVRLAPKSQAVLHAALLLGSLMLLPIIPDVAWKPEGEQRPTLEILTLLTATVGVPYLLLSTTGPLVQRWFSRGHPGRSPYRLYALSNVGSLLALVSYPVLVEPYLQLGNQATVWSWSYGAFVLFSLACAWQLAGDRGTDESAGAAAAGLNANPSPGVEAEAPDADRSPAARNTAQSLLAVEDPTSEDASARREPRPPMESRPPGSGEAAGDAAQEVLLRRPGAADVLMWLALATLPSVMLLAVTNQMCQEVAVVPFLWVLPLSLYLLSFILCFDSDRWYVRAVWFPLLFLSAAGAAWCLFHGVKVALSNQIAIYSGTLLAVCMTLHGELSRSRPQAQYLTLFYLMMATGGALGGVFVVLVAPQIFPRYWELHLGLVISCALALFAYYRAADRRWFRGTYDAFALLLPAGGVAALAGVLVWQAATEQEHMVARSRNFYGVLTVTRNSDKNGPYHTLRHGRISHGYQYLDEDKRAWITSYYGRETGIGTALLHHPRRSSPRTSGRALRIGVVGLGAGSLAVYAEPGDTLRYYEINPDVVDFAYRYFTYCEDCKGDLQIALGDARIQMERELAEQEPQAFDVLAIDAFSSDAIPMHLLTQECFAIYFEHLKADGILAVHISNRYLDLEPVVRTLAKQAGYTPLLFDWRPDDDEQDRLYANTWVLVTRNGEFLASPVVQERSSAWPAFAERTLLWTDDYGSLIQVLHRKW